MRKRYTLAHLDCAHCAQQIEDDLSRLPTLSSVRVDFSRLALEVDSPDSSSVDLDAIESRIKRIDPDVDLIDPEAGKPAASRSQGRTRGELIEWITLGSSLTLLVAAMITDRLATQPAWLPDTLPVALPIYLAAYLLAGGKVIIRAFRNIVSGRVFDEHLLMTIATVGAFAITEFAEAVAVMLFYKFGEILQNRAVNRSRRSIRDLLDLQPDTVRVVSDHSQPRLVPLDQLSVGDRMIVRPGERIPTDGAVRSGASRVDTSALTGEPEPRLVGPGDDLLGGFLNMDGLLEIEVTVLPSSSSAARIADLVEHAQERKARTELFITRFARYYTPAVVLIAAAIAVIPPLLAGGAAGGASFESWLYRALTMLVISCPCALVVSIPLTYFAGIGGASAHGILVKGATVFDTLAKVRRVAFDKTGTLTHGEFQVQRVVPYAQISEAKLLELAAAAESVSNHPIARSIVTARNPVDGEHEPSVTAYEERSGRGVIASIDSTSIIAGNDRLMHEERIDHDTCDVPGTVVHVAVDGGYAGYIVIGDRVRSGAAGIVDRLKGAGVGLTALFTGDRSAVAREFADQIGIDRTYGDLLPEDKVSRIEDFMADQHDTDRTAYVGDGINDAPVIARADVGVAMGIRGTEAAIDTADLVLMGDDPAGIVDAIRRSRRTHSIVIQNIVFAIGIKALILGFGAFGLATMWEAVIADVGVTVLAVLNATRALK